MSVLVTNRSNVKHKAFVVKNYFTKNDCSVTTTQSFFRQKFRIMGCKREPNRNRIFSWVRNFETSG